jgi:hypothetical protein
MFKAEDKRVQQEELHSVATQEMAATIASTRSVLQLFFNVNIKTQTNIILLAVLYGYETWSFTLPE